MYAEEMERLRAQESLNNATASAVGSGTMKRADSDRIIGAWRRQSGRSTRAPAATLPMIAAMGIGVRAENA